MNKRSRLTRIVIRYSLLQLPGLVLLVLTLIYVQKWVVIPAWIFWGVIILWAVKDAFLFRYTWRAYDWDHKNLLVGARGIAKDRLAPSGYVKVGGALWRAEVTGGGPPIESGMNIKVKSIRGLTLLVELDREENEAESLRLQRENISLDLIELRKVEANLKAIEKWNGYTMRNCSVTQEYRVLIILAWFD